MMLMPMMLLVLPQLCYGLSDRNANVVVETNARVHDEAESEDHTEGLLDVEAAAVPGMEPFILGKEGTALSGRVCSGKPTGDGTWNGLGKGVSEAECQKACLSSRACAFAVWTKNQRRGGRPAGTRGDCAEMASCSSYDVSPRRFKVWKKTAVATVAKAQERADEARAAPEVQAAEAQASARAAEAEAAAEMKGMQTGLETTRV
jgi:hypothetical protein